MQRGKRRLQQNEIAPAARFLEMSEADLVGLLEGRVTNEYTSRNISETNVRQGDANAPGLILYRSSLVETGTRGTWMLYAERAGEVERPDYLGFSKTAFAVRVLNDDNKPAYRARDVILIDPDSPAINGDDCIFAGSLPAETISGELIRDTPSLWIIRQHAIDGEREIPKAAFPNAWPIVAIHKRR
ncbi:MAG TPA: hypothetical protein VGE09_08360 [Pseudoxanthomonas sp.]